MWGDDFAETYRCRWGGRFPLSNLPALHLDYQAVCSDEAAAFDNLSCL